MASNKNQHFVPKCHFKPFSQAGEGASINLLNIDGPRFVAGASVKGQCSGNYFYGRDPVFERPLQQLEGAYGLVVQAVATEEYRLTHPHRQLLRDFCCLQHLRTAAASQRAVEMMNDAGRIVGEEAEGWFRVTIREAVQVAMAAFPRASRLVEDLKVVLVRNDTAVPFVTSDDPSVHANRWHHQDRRLGGLAPGLGSAGALFMLPLRPDVLCLVYDGGVYVVPNQHGWVRATNEADIRAFNEHQFLNCWSNIYFHDWNLADQVLVDFEVAAPRRPQARHVIDYAIWDHNELGAEVFRVVDPADADPHRRAIIHHRAVFANPSSWPRQISWRADGAAYTNGTGAGYLRRATIPLIGGDGYRRIQTRRAHR